MTARKAPTPATVTEAHLEIARDINHDRQDDSPVFVTTAVLAQAIADAEQRGKEAAKDEARCHLGCCEDEHVITLSDYEARALKGLLEAIGGATRWKIQASDKPANWLCNGDWCHQIYGKVLRLLAPDAEGGNDDNAE